MIRTSFLFNYQVKSISDSYDWEIPLEADVELNCSLLQYDVLVIPTLLLMLDSIGLYPTYFHVMCFLICKQIEANSKCPTLLESIAMCLLHVG